jgi:hypothetical protein
MFPSFSYLILAYYPELSPYVFNSGEIVLQDSGQGPYIAVWGSPLPKPTSEQLNSSGNQLAAAKLEGEVTVNAQSNEAAKKTLEGLSYDVYMAQCALPAEQRVAKYQAAIDANNAIALETEQREQAIYAATTIDEVNAIVYPSES